jgi:hypothetical protein
MGSYIVNHRTDLLGQMVDWDDWSHGRFARAADHVLPSIVLTIATLGVGGAGVKGGEAVGLTDEAASNLIFRTGAQTDNALTDAAGVSFRDSISSAADKTRVFRPGDKMFAIDTNKLPKGSVVRDGVPDGHVSVFATPEQIRQALTDVPWLGLKRLADGSYRLPK